VRTTIDLETVLLERARRRAAARGVTLSRLVCEAVSAYLNEAPSRGAEPPFELITCGDAGGYAPSPAEMSEERLDEDRIGSPKATAGKAREARSAGRRARA
jgi:hypothetical protein